MAVVTLPHTLTDRGLLSSLVLASPVPHPHSLARTHHPTATSSVIGGGRLLPPTSLARPWLVAWVLACSSRVLMGRYSHIQVPQYLTFVPGCDTSYHQTINPVKLCCNVEAKIWKRNHPTRSHTNQYDCLIEDVRKRCPNSVIITSNVPPRRRSTSTLRKIDALNSHLSRKIDCDGKITNIDVCPSMPAYFYRDQVHFNKRGADLYASKLAQSLVNFSWYCMREMM